MLQVTDPSFPRYFPPVRKVSQQRLLEVSIAGYPAAQLPIWLLHLALQSRICRLQLPSPTCTHSLVFFSPPNDCAKCPCFILLMAGSCSSTDTSVFTLSPFPWCCSCLINHSPELPFPQICLPCSTPMTHFVAFQDPAPSKQPLAGAGAPAPPHDSYLHLTSIMPHHRIFSSLPVLDLDAVPTSLKHG